MNDALDWQTSEYALGEVLAVTTLHHSHEPAFRPALPLHTGLVRLDAGPTAACFLTDGCAAGTRVRVTALRDSAGRTGLSASPATDSFAATTKGAS